jgi:hypothetical protein
MASSSPSRRATRMGRLTGVPYLVFDGRLPKVPEIVGRLGLILRKEERAGEIAKTAEHALQKLASITAKAVGKRVSVYYARGSDGLRAVRAGRTQRDFAGRRHIFSDERRRCGRFQTVGRYSRRSKSRGTGIPAAQSTADRNALSRRSRLALRLDRTPPSLNRLIGALWLASRLYPGEISFPVDDARRMSVALFHRVPTDPTINDMFR